MVSLVQFLHDFFPLFKTSRFMLVGISFSDRQVAVFSIVSFLFGFYVKSLRTVKVHKVGKVLFLPEFIEKKSAKSPCLFFRKIAIGLGQNTDINWRDVKFCFFIGDNP